MSHQVRIWYLVSMGFLVGILAVQASEGLSEKWSKRLEAASSTYQQAVLKADNTRFYAVQKANADRLKVLKQALADATKAGDFDAATTMNEHIAMAEVDGIVRNKPKEIVNFKGHQYSVMPGPVTWHLAKRQCEEMGGHLVTIESPVEHEFLLSLCRTAKTSAWIGLSNEVDQKQWNWVNGRRGTFDESWKYDDPERESIASGVVYWHPYETFTDYSFGARAGYICEWDS